jgi:hypothetical protein
MFLYTGHVVQIPLPYPRTFKAGLFPGVGGTNDRIPKGESPALEGPAGVHQAAFFPKDTVITGFFFEGKILRPLAEGNPAAPCFHEFLLPHFLGGGQRIQIFPGEEHVTAFITAAGGTPFAAKTEPPGIKRLLCHKN